MTMHQDHDRFCAACDYPGVLDEAAVERQLADYLKALGMQRQVVRLRQGWTLDEHPSIRRSVDQILDDVAKRIGWKRGDARAARAARPALAPRRSQERRDRKQCKYKYSPVL
ncbi:MAG: hypothetical protein P4L73_20645, partial [Caulobacteraceae bacterium]|nr:hypothetical protein [Caulobacteraceae bacterium]